MRFLRRHSPQCTRHNSSAIVLHWFLGETDMLRVVIVLLVLLMSSIAHAQKRVALVIGNSAYKHTGELTNPRNDAVDMAAALKRFGFQAIEGYDLDKASFDRKVREF